MGRTSATDGPCARMTKTGIRRALYHTIDGNRWILPTACLLTGVASVVICESHPSGPLSVLTAVSLGAISYAWGYGTRALKRVYPRWPRLKNLQRREYAQVWNA